MDALPGTALSLDRAMQLSDHSFVWRARLRDGTVLHEQPGLSSDALPRHDVVGIDYVPRVAGLPVISGHVDVGRGERFVRYWTTLWSQHRRDQQRLYVLGVERDGRYALFGFYPRYRKGILAARRPFTPPWVPRAFADLPDGVVLRGGAGTPMIGWQHQGFGGELRIQEGQLVFRAVH